MKVVPGALLSAVVMGAVVVEAAVDLEKGFLNPPDNAKSETWWHVSNGNISKEGITADLEAMKAVGIGGAQLFDIHGDAPAGPVPFASDAWFDHVLWAHKEAQRLGLRLTLHNSSGYSVAGGTWITPEESMKRVAWTVTDVTGPGTWQNEVLPKPSNKLGYSRDIAVLAVRKPDGMHSIRLDEETLVTETRMPSRVENGWPFTEWGYEFAAKNPFTAREVTFTLEGPQIWGARGDIKAECSEDGATWKTIKEGKFPVCYHGDISDVPHYWGFPETKAKFFRVTLKVPNGYPGTRTMESTYKVSRVDVGAFATDGDLASRTYRVTSNWSGAPRKLGADEIVKEADIVDLTDRMGADGRLWWRIPEGRWQIIRFAEVSTGSVVAPASFAGKGLETDKFSEKATRKHFDAYIGKVAKITGIDPKSDPWKRSGFVSALIDSYEAGGQNWGENFAAEFLKRRGYAIDGKKMAVYAGFMLESRENTDRILADLRKTFGELFAEKFSDVFADCCRKAGILFAVEPYSGQAASNEDYGRKADLPMCEFWHSDRPYNLNYSVPSVVSIARKNGNRIIGAEAFTTAPGKAWITYPYDYKAMGDLAYTLGVNRFVYHTFSHQPWTKPTRYPGMCMTQWGSHFDRTETWWPYFSGWVKYQQHAQYLLQEGEFVDNDAVSSDKDVRTIHRRYPGGVDAWFVADEKESENTQVCSFPVTGRLPELWDAETVTIADAKNWRIENGKTEVTVDFKPSGSVFVVFRKPTDLKGNRTIEQSSSRTIPVSGVWKVTFPIDWTTSKPKPKTVEFAKLIDWTESDDDDVKYFSGTAEYVANIDLSNIPAFEHSSDSLVLDLGKVNGIAEVAVDGKTLPFLWRPPYRIDITEAVKDSKRTTTRKDSKGIDISIKVTNNWKNRLIGDERMYERDFVLDNFRGVKFFPEYVEKGLDSPTGRSTFSSFHHWNKEDTLQPSGLIGPVNLVYSGR